MLEDIRFRLEERPYQIVISEQTQEIIYATVDEIRSSLAVPVNSSRDTGHSPASHMLTAAHTA
jgi:hypothetical protein